MYVTPDAVRQLLTGTQKQDRSKTGKKKPPRILQYFLDYKMRVYPAPPLDFFGKKRKETSQPHNLWQVAELGRERVVEPPRGQKGIAPLDTLLVDPHARRALSAAWSLESQGRFLTERLNNKRSKISLLQGPTHPPRMPYAGEKRLVLRGCALRRRVLGAGRVLGVSWAGAALRVLFYEKEGKRGRASPRRKGHYCPEGGYGILGRSMPGRRAGVSWVGRAHGMKARI